MSTLAWFTGKANKNNTSSIETRDFQSPAYVATLAVTVTKRKTLVQVGTLTGAITINAAGLPTSAADDNAPFVGDSIDFLFTSDGVADHVITWGTHFKANAATSTLTSGKKGKASFTFDGVDFVGSFTVTA